jgi:F-type H+-transporting ATPase subunit b
MLDVNLTLLIQLGNFIITLVVLNFLLIRPVRDIIRRRREIASGLLQDTENFLKDAEERLACYEEALVQARIQGAKHRESCKKEALRREDDILAEAQAETREFLLAMSEKTRKSAEAAEEELFKRIPDLAADAADALLGTPRRSKS